MNRQDFGKLITALRKEHTDPDDKVWTQEQLAKETKLSSQQIGDIERGEKANIEPDILLALAKALQLTNGERKELLIAASGIDNEDIPQDDPPEVVLNELLKILEKVYLPSFIMDSFGDIVAMNLASVKMYQSDISVIYDNSVNQATRFNVMRFVFSDQFDNQRKMMGETWPRFIHSTMTIFRTASLRYRAHPYFRWLLM